MNMNRLLAAVFLAAFSTLLTLTACSSDEEALPSQTVASTTTPAQSATSVATVPVDWATYTDPGGLFTVRYPSDWFTDGSNISNTDPKTWQGPAAPPDLIQVQLGYTGATGSNTCGMISVDAATGEMIGPLDDAKATVLGGIQAWRIVRTQGDPAVEGRLTRIEGVATVHSGYCVDVTAYFTEQDPDVDTFNLIVEDFCFSG